MCPPSFIEIASIEEWNLTSLTTTTPIIIIIAKMKPHNNKIPFPFWGNGITRGTVPWGTVNPIPIRLVTGTKDKVSPGNSRWQQLAPFERASVTSYSTLMVTMDLCASVSKLQPSEICLKCAWPPFDLWGHSRLKPMAAFERACMTSYSTLIVSMRLSVTVWKIQPFENTWPNGHIGHR